MRAVDIIIKKRDRQELSRAEIEFFVKGLTDGSIPDYQVSAWAMAVLLNGMTPQETTDLTLAMAHSGDVLDLSGLVEIAVDKHSTGGVGDKTSLVVLPVVAACGLPVGKMSGRGLGFSGGTLDKLESIPGYRVDLTTEEFERQLQEIGLVLTGQSKNLAPADGLLYALRDVTGTVQSIPLIASSIMSKKIAAGAQAIVLDVKVGRGAFMKDLDQARALARQMISIGELAGRRVVTLLSDMNQPLGNAVGNALEVREAIVTLQGGGPADLGEHCLHVAAHMLVLGRCARDLESARRMAVQAIASGAAFEKFCLLVEAQGGDVAFVHEPQKLPQAEFVEVLAAERAGYLSGVDARVIGEAAVALGAGRLRKGDPIDHTVGFLVHARVGDRIQAGQPLITIHANRGTRQAKVRGALQEAFEWSDDVVRALPLFYE
ncbi:MAG: thymidine phosphorylase [Anaerolineales bacterium]|nr:thymidine phosphorylase [Anaerolineales bacterium]